MPKGNATRQAYRLHMNAAGTFQEQGIQLMRSEVVQEYAQDVIDTLKFARKTNTARDVFFDVHNQKGITAIRERFNNRPAVPPQPPAQPSESDS